MMSVTHIYVTVGTRLSKYSVDRMTTNNECPMATQYTKLLGLARNRNYFKPCYEQTFSDPSVLFNVRVSAENVLITTVVVDV